MELLKRIKIIEPITSELNRELNKTETIAHVNKMKCKDKRLLHKLARSRVKKKYRKEPIVFDE